VVEARTALLKKFWSAEVFASAKKFWSAEVFASAKSRSCEERSKLARLRLSAHASAETDALQNAIFVKTNLTV